MKRGPKKPVEKRTHTDHRTPKTARRAIRILLVFGILGTVWTYVAELPEIAFASGSIQPTGALRRIEHLDGGVVKKILAREGQTIDWNDGLAVLSEDDVNAEFEGFRVRENILTMALDRNRQILNAIGFNGRQKTHDILGGLRMAAQLKAYEATRLRLAERVSIAQSKVEATSQLLGNLEARREIELREMERTRKLVSSGIRSNRDMAEFELRENDLDGSFLRAAAAVAEAEAEKIEATNALNEFYATTRDTLLADIEKSSEELSLLQRAIIENRLRRDRLLLTTPVGGVVQALYVTSVHEVIEPGGLVAEVLPTGEKLIAELRLKPSDIGHIKVGDPVEIQLTTFNTKRFGLIDGRIYQISATSTENDQFETFFKVRVDLADEKIGDGITEFAIKAGMEVNASIVTGSRTVLEYLAEPLIGPFRGAFRER